MLQPAQFRRLVIRPTIASLGLASAAAENLLLGTALVESGLSALVQHGGPALGVFQIEPATHADLWRNFLGHRPVLAEKIARFRAAEPDGDDQLATNLAYATAIARLIYYRAREPLPAASDIEGLGHYWKQHYNTPVGKGRPEHFVEIYNRHAKE